MSAFMFRASPETIRKLSDSELEEEQKRLEQMLSMVNWAALRQCTFEFDQVYGRRATLEMIVTEVQLRKQGRYNEPLPVAMVPGFNP